MTAQIRCVRQLDDFEKGVFDDGIGQTGGNIRHGGPLLLGLLHVGVHKDCAAGAQIHGIPGEQSLFCKAGGVIAKRIGEIFNKGAAARGTGLVEQHIFHRMVPQLDALHVLPADVQHTVHLRVKKGGGGAVGHGLHLALVQTEGRFQQGFAVACGAGTDDAGFRRQAASQLRHGVHGGADGVALVVGIEREQQLPLAADQRQFGGGGAGVNAQKAVAPIGLQGRLGHHGPVMAGAEGFVIGRAFKQRRQPLQLKGHFHLAAQPLLQLGEQDRGAAAGLQCRAHGGKQVGVFRVHDGLGRQLQGADKGLFQLGQKVQRAAQKGHAPPDGLAAGQAGNGLLHHSLKDGGRQIGLGSPLVDEGLDVGLGKHAAPGGDGINLPVVGRFLVEPGGVGLQQGGHLVDKGAGTAGADAVHALLQPAPEVDDLGVLAAQFDGHIGLGRRELQSRGHRHHLLNEGDTQDLAQIDGAGARDAEGKGAVAHRLAGVLQKGSQRLLGAGAVAYVFSEDQLVPAVEQYQLHCGGADVDTCAIKFHAFPPKPP